MTQEQPFFSIVVPTHARPRQLADCLQSCANLDYPRDRFEVIVVDDGSGTPEDVTIPFQGRLDMTMLTQPHAGPGAARNRGAACARGEILAFTDDDCTPAPDWLRALAARFVTAPGHVIGGRTLNALATNPYSTASQLLIKYVYAYYNRDPNQACFLATNNLALPVHHFRAIGGFDTIYTLTASEDRELCDRWLYHGYQMTYAPEALVFHAHRLTFRTFLRQHFNYGRGAFQFRQARAQRSPDRLRLEPFSFYLKLLRYPCSQARGWQALLVAALLAVTQAARGAGFLWEGAGRIVDRCFTGETGDGYSS